MTYEGMLEQVDKGRLPVIVFYRADWRPACDLDVCFYATTCSVQPWSPILTGDEATRGELVAQVVVATAQEAIRLDPDL